MRSIRQHPFVMVPRTGIVAFVLLLKCFLPPAVFSQCRAGEATLCLEERFQVTVDWANRRSLAATSGVGHAVALSDHGGFFWFFRPDNIELITKVLDGRSLSGRHWYFHAPLTDVEFLVQVLDVDTGFRYRYFNPESQSDVVQDLAAFDDRPLDGRVLVVLAHPDDEGLFAPLLAKLCLDRSQVCRFVALTRGENGPCLLEAGCGEDLGALRAQEMAASAKLFGAELTIWQLPDVFQSATPDQVRKSWETSSASTGDLRARLTQEMLGFGPDVVLAFDPRHGSTCHPAHRASAALAVEAAQELDKQPSIFLMTTAADFGQEDGEITAAFGEPQPGDPDVLSFFGDWNFVNLAMQQHPSQFTVRFRETVQSVPGDQKAVHLVPASRLSDETEYQRCEK